MSDGPIGRYPPRGPVVIADADPRGAAVAARLAALVQEAFPDCLVEHVGSTAVPGLAGKGVVDLLVVVEAAQVPAVTDALLGLGFQRQSSGHLFPPERPMLEGSLDHDGTCFKSHVHVVAAGRHEVAELRGFRDGLRADPALAAEYEALKRRIVAEGKTEPAAFSEAKNPWMAATLARLGLRDGRPG